jgi:hypothetical protein
VGHARKPARALDGEREWGSEVVVATGRGWVKIVHVTEPAFFFFLLYLCLRRILWRDANGTLCGLSVIVQKYPPFQNISLTCGCPNS